MAWIDRFQKMFKRQEQAAPAVTQMPAPIRPSAVATMFQADADRRSTILDCRQMYKDDPRAKGVLKALSKDATRAGFELVVEGPRAEEAKAAALEMLKRVQLAKRLDDWVRLTLRDGDSFLEVAAAANGLIMDVSRKPTLEVIRRSDEFDQFIDPTAAFAWADNVLLSVDVLTNQLPAGATVFAEWQIVHARYDQDEDSRYGSPLFAAARKPYKRMTEGEFDIAIRRKTRAGMKYVHALKDANETDIEAYRVRNQDVLDDPFAAVADFFSNKDTTVTSLQGDAHLGEIEDVLHHIRTWWIASPVPMSLLGYGQDLNRDVLDEQQKQYKVACEELSRWASEQIIKPLIERQWLLLGIWPDALEWEIEWAAKDALTADGFVDAAKALAALRATGVFSDETLLRMFSRFVPDFDAEAELALLAKRLDDEMAAVAMNAAASMPAAGEDAGDDEAE